jgi:hypothetical protein
MCEAYCGGYAKGAAMKQATSELIDVRDVQEIQKKLYELI